MERRAQRFVSALGLQGEELVRIRLLQGQPAAQTALEGFASDLESDLWLLQDGKIILENRAVPPNVDLHALSATATPEGVRRQHHGIETIAITLRSPDGTPSSVRLISIARRPAMIWRTLEREAQRLVLIVLVAGGLSLILARYLSRPLSRLREASSRIARGDLAVRVTPSFRGESREVMEMAHDFDTMAERIEALIESQQRLLRDVSHELRSPLARLGVALELARKRSGPDAQSALDRIERDSVRLGELISEILDVSRLETRTHAGELEAVDLAALITDIVADVDFEAQGQARRVTLAHTAATPLITHARPELLRRAFENVLRNAVRFAPEGSAVSCTVSAAHDNGHRFAEIIVRDHGPGVPEEELTEIFRPFYRVGTARDRHTGGAGIGLAIVERAVRLHGGHVHAVNGDGDGGLKVVIRLPIDGDDVHPVPHLASAQAPADSPAP